MHDKLSARRTYKVIGDPTTPDSTPSASTDRIDQILISAGNAPFHCACDRLHQSGLGSPVPWRVYKLAQPQCRSLMNKLIQNNDTTKIPAMLAAAECLLQVTWLPDAGTIQDNPLSKENPIFDGTLRNMEHIAAASAMIQSLLLAAEHEGFKTYWSSGGPLRNATTFQWLGIPQSELLLGSVFLFPQEPENAEIKPGALAQSRGETDQWSRWCEIKVD